MFRILKRWCQDFNLMHTYHTCYIFLGWKVMKNGSLIVWFHPILINFAKKQYEWTYLVFESLSILSMSWAHTISWTHINFEYNQSSMCLQNFNNLFTEKYIHSILDSFQPITHSQHLMMTQLIHKERNIKVISKL